MTSLAEGVALRTAAKEAQRVDRWWATYNAALTGIYANAEDYGNASPIDLNNVATVAANLAHGKLVEAQP
jgi:hypothetical protein